MSEESTPAVIDWYAGPVQDDEITIYSRTPWRAIATVCACPACLEGQDAAAVADLLASAPRLKDALKNIAGMARAWMEGTDPYLGDALTAARFEKAAKDAIASIDGEHTAAERAEANHNNELARTTRMK